MPSKKKKYNARFPAGRIKKIMQSDEEIGKVAQAVPVIIVFKTIPKTLELFVESLLTKTLKITNSRNAKTLSPSHMKQCIMAENRFDFLRELVKNIPDISVAEEISNDSSPEATIDPSDTPYDLSMPSTSNTNETSTQKAMPSNGCISLIRNNGVTRSCGTTIVASPLQSSTLNVGESEEVRAHLKREWNVMSRIQNQIQTKTAALANNSSRSLSTEGTPPKLFRTDSAPAGIRAPQLLTTSSSSLLSSSIQEEQNHHKQPNQVLPTDLRRLRHQTKSVPGNICTETVSSQKNNIKPQTPTTAIPPTIVSIDFCNKPIVKIDYSNLALHDTNYSESPTSSSSSPTVDLINRSSICIPKNPLQTSIAESPVINIDLSNIVTSGTFATSSLHPSVISSNCAGVPVPVPVPPAIPPSTSKNSFLELDEDYDNI